MKQEYMKPEAEKLTFDFSENVTASFAWTDVSTQWNECHNRIDYGDTIDDNCRPSPDQLNEAFSYFWVCNDKT